MIEKIDTCPICGKKEFVEYISCNDHFLSKESFSIKKCKSCSFLLTTPRPVTSAIGNYYKSDQYISHTNKVNNLLHFVYKTARHFTLRNKVKLINRISEDKSILDFGCGTGDFLLACQNNSWKINGFEPDSAARHIASESTNSPIFSTLNELNNGKYDLITLWHVLEHIHDLNNTLEKLISSLSPNGKILIAVPNYKSYDASLYKENWAAYDVPRHLYHFSQSSMLKLLEKHGLKINETIPMKLDSFYVSLLSEKYKNGTSNYVKSFINGYKSNNYANKHSNNYSSLIYIASK